ncbi:MAG: peptidoglycan DD-metalloendopeptidase family protein [Acidobacteriota bacterium]|nr:peptidoglycan DD-metalloendopeptidase family protein [Acidobacteriota bacterium]
MPNPESDLPAVSWLRASVLGLLLLIPLQGVSAGSVGGQQESRERALENIRREIESLEARLEEVSRDRDDSAARLQGLGLEVRIQVQRVAEVRAERRLVEVRLAEAAVAFELAEERLGSSRRQLRRGIVVLYRLARGGLWRWVLTAPKVEQALSAIRHLRYLSWREAFAVERYRGDQATYRESRKRWQAEARRSQELLASERGRLRRLEELRARQKRIVEALDREQTGLAERSRELLRRQARMTELIGFLSGRLPDVESGSPIQRFRGVLDWPVDGEVLTPFGPRIDPRYGTQVPHDGVTFTVAPKAAATAVFPGVVVFAAEFEGFGITVVVHHPSRVFTLYSGLELAEVEKDDVVSSGQRLGVPGARMYFEVRVEDRPEDPLEWLR